MHTQEAVVVLAAGGVIATIKVEALTDAFVVQAIDLVSKLVGAAVIDGKYLTTKGQVVEPVVGMRS